MSTFLACDQYVVSQYFSANADDFLSAIILEKSFTENNSKQYFPPVQVLVENISQKSHSIQS